MIGGIAFWVSSPKSSAPRGPKISSCSPQNAGFGGSLRMSR
jgi:hypothetical protein